MDITKYFIHFRKPSQYIYAGENYLEVFRLEKNNYRMTGRIDNVSLLNLNSYELGEIKKSQLLDVETGLILNSSQFIFNIFEFDKIPFREKLKQDLVEWRLQKVFPEDVQLYEHSFFPVAKNKILSVLVRQNTKEKIEESFQEAGIDLIHIGNSTVEIIDHLLRKKSSPDFFVEVDNHLAIVVFFNESSPYYIRKFRIDRLEDISAEILKTLNYVKSSYSTVPSTYGMAINIENFEMNSLKEQLSESGLVESNLKISKKIIFPG